MIVGRAARRLTKVASRKRSSEPNVSVIRHRTHIRRETNMYAEKIQSVKSDRRELARLGYKKSMARFFLPQSNRKQYQNKSRIKRQLNLDEKLKLVQHRGFLKQL